MSKINLFLQKMKMHENHHGIVMVITAYALSFLMLVLGSDVFYNIKSAAAGESSQTNEETQELTDKDILGPNTVSSETTVLQTNLINPYGLDAKSGSDTIGSNAVQTSADETDSDQLPETQGDISLIEQMHSVKFAQAETSNTKGTTKAKTSKTKTSKRSTKEKAAVESLSSNKNADTVRYDLTNEEVDMLERIVEAEASGEDMVGKILIANVIFNRMADDDFPDTVEKVIFQKTDGEYQFSPISDERFWSVNVSDETEKAVQRALKGEDFSKGALYFMSRENARESSARWFDQELKWLFKHGGHEFYK
jgi:N-acetylmuramoyl-L-alanine amidase